MYCYPKYRPSSLYKKGVQEMRNPRNRPQALQGDRQNETHRQVTKLSAIVARVAVLWHRAGEMDLCQVVHEQTIQLVDSRRENTLCLSLQAVFLYFTNRGRKNCQASDVSAELLQLLNRNCNKGCDIWGGKNISMYLIHNTFSMCLYYVYSIKDIK